MGPGKGKLGIAIGLVTPKKKEPEIDEGPLEGEDNGEVTAMQAFMDAMRGDDPQAALAAYKHVKQLCEASGEY